jgi:hypothetical protein
LFCGQPDLLVKHGQKWQQGPRGCKKEEVKAFVDQQGCIDSWTALTFRIVTITGI